MTTQHGWGQRPVEAREATLVLVRHGETIWNQEGRVQGHSESALTERGVEQGLRAARRLAGVRIEAVYSSDSERALETARLLAGPHKLEVKVRQDLRERSYGVLEGKTLAEAARTEGTWILGWQADRRTAPPAGESQDQMCERFMDAVREIAAAHPDDAVAPDLDRERLHHRAARYAGRAARGDVQRYLPPGGDHRDCGRRGGVSHDRTQGRNGSGLHR